VTADTKVVEISRRFAVPPETLFDAWLDPDCARHWLFATPDGVMERVEIEPCIGGGFRIEERRGETLAEHYGEYVEIDRPRQLAFDFWTSFSAERTRVTVTIAPDGDGARLTLTHQGVWADYEDRTRRGWTMMLEGLARTMT
jgi:uncharacterized protein YndB with AHSA1/START domain